MVPGGSESLSVDAQFAGFVRFEQIEGDAVDHSQVRWFYVWFLVSMVYGSSSLTRSSCSAGTAAAVRNKQRNFQRNKQRDEGRWGAFGVWGTQAG